MIIYVILFYFIKFMMNEKLLSINPNFSKSIWPSKFTSTHALVSFN